MESNMYIIFTQERRGQLEKVHTSEMEKKKIFVKCKKERNKRIAECTRKE